MNISSYGSSNFNSTSSNTNSSSKLLNISHSHYVGMEIISKLCAKLEFKWNLVQNNDKITFTLDIPIVSDAIPNTDNGNLQGIMV